MFLMKHANVARSGVKWAAHVRAAAQHVELAGSASDNEFE